MNGNQLIRHYYTLLVLFYWKHFICLKQSCEKTGRTKTRLFLDLLHCKPQLILFICNIMDSPCIENYGIGKKLGEG